VNRRINVTKWCTVPSSKSVEQNGHGCNGNSELHTGSECDGLKQTKFLKGTFVSISEFVELRTPRTGT
jgi:hypothetical protein